MLNLGEPVLVFVVRNAKGSFYQAGTVIGRTIEQNPRYDIRLTSGEMEQGVTEDKILNITQGGNPPCRPDPPPTTSTPS